MREVFWINHEQDREAASDGVSRYGVYVRLDRRGFAECWDGTFESRLPERFAARAWRTATGPVMSPAYVGWRAPVMSAGFEVDYDDDAGLIASVDLASPWPRELGGGIVAGRLWRPWPRESDWGGKEWFRRPYGTEVASGGYALASLRLVFPVATEILPPAPAAEPPRRGLEDSAGRAVAALVSELNRFVGPVVDAVER